MTEDELQAVIDKAGDGIVKIWLHNPCNPEDPILTNVYAASGARIDPLGLACFECPSPDGTNPIHAYWLPYIKTAEASPI